MPPTLCESCKTQRALILRPKNHNRLCRTCFIAIFELEIHNTIIAHSLFTRGETVAIGASGGKDSTVLASVMKTLNERYDYGLDLVLLSIDEGITGYRDDSLETVKRNATQYGMPLEILGYKELYGWTMDEVVKQVGKKGNCTYCGVFRRQALDRGAAKLGVQHVVTGHNADDIAETVLMNLLRGDLPRLSRATSILTASASSPIKRSKPLKYAYEKEIVLYAHHKKLDYFSTECIYSPEAFRGSARALIKNLERIRPSAILDVVRSGEDMAKLVPDMSGQACVNEAGKKAKKSDARRKTGDVKPDANVADEEEAGGCGSGAGGRTGGGEMAEVERKLREDEEAEAEGREVEITIADVRGQRHDRDTVSRAEVQPPPEERVDTPIPASETAERAPTRSSQAAPQALPSRSRKVHRQQMGQCQRCGYISSQDVCKACMLLEGLNRNRPRVELGTKDDGEETGSNMMRQMELVEAVGK